MLRICVRVVFQALVVLLVVGSGIALWANAVYNRAGPLRAPATVVIPKGESLDAIARRIASAGVIRDPRVFGAIVRVTRLDKDLRAGEYAFSPGVSMREATRMMLDGVTVKRRLTVAEGLTTRQILALVAEAEGLQGDLPGLVPEGSLLPETYFYDFGDTRTAVVGRMRTAMREAVDALWERRAPNLVVASKKEALVLASIVEKETGRADERPRVSAVFHNRLRLRMRLQSDPTVVYALTEGNGSLDRPLTREDLTVESPYNTYRVRGLPPTPIANPGRDSIAAVLNPARIKDLYFVADGTGGHVFARTLGEHNRNVARWRRVRREQRRKSPDRTAVD